MANRRERRGGKRDKHGTLPSPADRQQLEATAQKLAGLIGGVMDPQGVHFFLALGTFGPGWATWVSNGDREANIQMLRETASRLETRSDVPPGVRPDPDPQLVRFSTRKVNETPSHTTLTVFANSANCGNLTLRNEEARALVELLYTEQPVS